MAKGIILRDQGTIRRQSSGGLQIISNKPIAFRCRICSMSFTDEERRQWIQHVTACAKGMEAEIREAEDLGHQMPGLFGPDAGDVEYREWHRERKGWRC